ncbi:MAG TPA: energy-coupling factor transporter ATPase [Ktedonobacterales bacterium]
MIELADVRYAYGHDTQDGPPAVDGVTLSFAPGQIVGLLGQNGSGKSTLARLIAGILRPQSGLLAVDGLRVDEREQRREARSLVGLVFQNPDDQLITNTLIDEIAFGPENLGLPRDVIQRNVDLAINLMGLAPFISTPLNELSLGQRQRVAIAGALAMDPRYLILDEPSSMLPAPLVGQLLATVRRLTQERNIGAIWITHHIEETVELDRVVVMSHGSVALDGSPRETLTQIERMRALRLEAPPVVVLAAQLRARGYPIQPTTITPDELCVQVRGLAQPAGQSRRADEEREQKGESPSSGAPPSTPVLEARHLAFTHLRGTPFAQEALRDVSCRIQQGTLVAFVGATRAGKSTLLDCFNAIVRPSKGMLWYKGADTGATGFDVLALRRAVGVVYQTSENQILEDVVGKDVAFSLMQRKTPFAESRRIVQESLEAVGLAYEEFRNRYTYALSGGEKRRVAIAGALAASPEVLVMDEPMAGLDPQGRADFLKLIRALRARRGMTLVYMSAGLDEVTSIADYVYALDAGAVALDGVPATIMRQLAHVERLGIGLSPVSRLALALATVAPDLDTSHAELDALETELVSHLTPAPRRTLPPNEEAVS